MINNKKIIKWFITVFAFALIIFAATSFTSNACRTGNCYPNGHSSDGAATPCGCGGGRNPCWINSYYDKCRGHNFNGYYGGSSNATCTSGGVIYVNAICEHCGTHTNVRFGSTGPLGHLPQNGYSYNSSSHWKICTRNAQGCGHSIVWGPQAHSMGGWYDCGSYHRRDCSVCDYYETEGHIADSSREYQANDWQWHQPCQKCSHAHVSCGWNTAYITFYDKYAGNTAQVGSTNGSDAATSPGAFTSDGKTRLGWVEHSSSPNNTYNSPLTKNWNWDCSTPRTYNPYVSQARNSRTGYDSAAAVYAYNYVTIIYNSGYLDNTQYIDTYDYTGYWKKQGGQSGSGNNYTTRPITSYTRTGYDIASNGWYATNANTYNTGTHTENLSPYHQFDIKINPVNTSATATYRNGAGTVLTGSNYTGQAYNKTLKVDELYIGIKTQYNPTVNYYARWRAHALVVNYDTNGGTNKPASQTMYYSDGKSYNEQGRPTKYNLTQTVPTRAGYTFMGWGNAARWDNCTSGTKAYDVYGELNSQTRYAYSASPQAGYYEDYNGVQTRSTTMTAQAWAAFGAEKKCAHNKVRAKKACNVL